MKKGWMLKVLTVFVFIASIVILKGETYDINKIVNCIYIIEGGSKTKFPYGIKSLDTKGNKDAARKVCYNTVAKTYANWTNSTNRNKDFLEVLANKYCPAKTDKQGNINWKKNIRFYYYKK